MTDPVTQGKTITDEEEIREALDEMREELQYLGEALDAEQDPDKRIALQEQIAGKQDVILLLECELDMAAETA